MSIMMAFVKDTAKLIPQIGWIKITFVTSVEINNQRQHEHTQTHKIYSKALMIYRRVY